MERKFPAAAWILLAMVIGIVIGYMIERRYTRWFLQKLPSGVSLDLPMGPQLETIVRSLKATSE